MALGICIPHILYIYILSISVSGLFYRARLLNGRRVPGVTYCNASLLSHPLCILKYSRAAGGVGGASWTHPVRDLPYRLFLHLGPAKRD